MKLLIGRDQDKNITVKIKIAKETIDFEYPVFIEHLFDGEVIDDPQYSTDISDDEIVKLNKMIEELKSAVKKYKKNP